MTQFKVGDRVRRKDGLEVWDGGPDTAIVKGIHKDHHISVVAHPNNGASDFDETRDWVMSSGRFHLVSTTPPATIQHEGYNYTRGEPVVPEWVKDGAWVVHKESGELNQLIAGDPGYFKAVNKKTWHAFVLDFHPSMSVSDVFRPFTNEDWKWGMWAEYKGEKVFVHGTGLTGIFASRPGNGYFPAYFSELTPTTAP